MPPPAQTGIHRRLGPLSVGGWIGVGAGSLAVLWLWRRYQAQKAAAAAANPPLTGGTTIPPGGSTGASTPQGPQTLTAWEQAAISAMTGPAYSATQAFNDISNWLSGNPVSPQGATALGNVIATLGLPPTGGTLGPITVASTTTSPPTAPSPNPPPPTTAPTPSPTPSQQQTLSGLISGFIGNQPGQFELVPGTEQNLALAAAGITQYVQVAPGIFAPGTPTQGSVGYGVYSPQTYIQVPGS